MLMKPEGSVGCHQTLSSWVGPGDETSTGQMQSLTHDLRSLGRTDLTSSNDFFDSPLLYTITQALHTFA